MRKLLLTLLLISLPARAGAEIVVTIKPIYSLVKMIAKDDQKVKLLLDGNQTPHSFSLKPSQIRELNDAKIVFYIDGSFETFLKKALKNTPKYVRKSEIAQKGRIRILEYRNNFNLESTIVDSAKHDDHSNHHHGHNHDHSNHDMHIWLDYKNAIRILKYIKKELSIIYPQNATLYDKNYKASKEKIRKLGDELKQVLIPAKGKNFVVFHDAYQYFEYRYNLKAAGSINLEPGQNPSISKVKEIRNIVKKQNVKCVFAEPQFSDKLVKLVIEGSNAKYAKIDPLGTGLKNDKDLYFKLMRNLANDFVKCLK